MSIIIVSDVKKAGALLFTNTQLGNHKQATDDDIQKLIDEIEAQTLLWLNSNGIIFNKDYPVNYNAKRLIILETLINIAISYNISSNKDYIDRLILERDNYKKSLEENMPRFSAKAKHVSPPAMKNGGVFG